GNDVTVDDSDATGSAMMIFSGPITAADNFSITEGSNAADTSISMTNTTTVGNDISVGTATATGTLSFTLTGSLMAADTVTVTGHAAANTLFFDALSQVNAGGSGPGAITVDTSAGTAPSTVSIYGLFSTTGAGAETQISAATTAGVVDTFVV